jgi:hypothetical protein
MARRMRGFRALRDRDGRQQGAPRITKARLRPTPAALNVFHGSLHAYSGRPLGDR